MIKFLFFVIVLVHGLVHFMGFAKAFGYGNITQLSKDITRGAGIAWLFTALLFVAAAILFLSKKDGWAVIAIIAVVISQILIISAWKDAKFGTIANIIILLVAVSSLSGFYFETAVKKKITELPAGGIIKMNNKESCTQLKGCDVNLADIVRTKSEYNIPA